MTAIGLPLVQYARKYVTFSYSLTGALAVITHPIPAPMARKAGAGRQARVARITLEGLAALRRAVSIVVRTSASA